MLIARELALRGRDVKLAPRHVLGACAFSLTALLGCKPIRATRSAPASAALDAAASATACVSAGAPDGVEVVFRPELAGCAVIVREPKNVGVHAGEREGAEQTFALKRFQAGIFATAAVRGVPCGHTKRRSRAEGARLGEGWETVSVASCEFFTNNSITGGHGPGGRHDKPCAWRPGEGAVRRGTTGAGREEEVAPWRRRGRPTPPPPSALSSSSRSPAIDTRPQPGVKP